MNVVQLTPELLVPDGVGRVAQVRSEGLQAAGHQVCVITSKYQCSLSREIDVQIVPIDRCFRTREYPAKVVEALRQADVAIVDYSSSHPLLDVLLLHRPRRLVINYHGLAPPELIRDDRYTGEYLRAVHRLQRLGGCDVLLTESQFMQRECASLAGWKGDRQVVIHLFGEERPAQSGDVVSRKPGLNLLCVGRQYPHKNFECAIQAAALLHKEKVPVQLIIAGGGDDQISKAYQARLRELVESLNAGSYVQLTGRLSRERLLAEYAACDALILPSYHEGFAIPIAEAMAFGKPIIGSDTGCVGETIGDAGVLFSPFHPEQLAQRIKELLLGSDRSQLEAIQVRSRARFEHFSSARFQRETQALLEEIVAEAAPVTTGQRLAAAAPVMSGDSPRWQTSDVALEHTRGAIHFTGGLQGCRSPTLFASLKFDDGRLPVFRQIVEQTWQRDGDSGEVLFRLDSFPDATEGELVLELHDSRDRCDLQGHTLCAVPIASLARPGSAIQGRDPQADEAKRLLRMITTYRMEPRYPEPTHVHWYQRVLLGVAKRVLDLIYLSMLPREEVNAFATRLLTTLEQSQPTADTSHVANEATANNGQHEASPR